MNNKYNNVLLITGCIDPVPQKYLVLNDVGIRLEQYIQSLEFYILKSNFKKIVFCENSNFAYKKINELTDLATNRGKKFEWISFRGNSKRTAIQGKGFGEGEIVEYALKNSKLLQECEYFTKVTGRLIVSNINEIAESVRFDKYRIFMNRDIYRRKGIDTRLYIINKNVYVNYFLRLYKNVSDDNITHPRALEDIFYIETLKHKNKWANLSVYPRFIGISGGNGRNYTAESKTKINMFSFLCKHNVFNTLFVISYIYEKIRA